MSSANAGRAYKNFLKEYERRKPSSVPSMNSSNRKGLLAPKTERNKSQMVNQMDRMDSLITIVDEIRKYGGKVDEQQ